MKKYIRANSNILWSNLTKSENSMDMEYSEGFDRVIIPIIESACTGERAVDKYSNPRFKEFVYLIDISRASGNRIYTFADNRYLHFSSIQDFKEGVLGCYGIFKNGVSFTSENNLLTVSNGEYTWTVYVLPDYARLVEMVFNCCSVYEYYYEQFRFDDEEDKRVYSFLDDNYGVNPWIKDWCDFSYLVPVKVR